MLVTATINIRKAERDTMFNLCNFLSHFIAVLYEKEVRKKSWKVLVLALIRELCILNEHVHGF